MTEEPLLSEKTSDGGSRSVWLSRSANGNISIEGQDIGDLSGFFGSGVREYEWAHSVAAEQVPALVDALGGLENADVMGLVKARFSGVRHGEFAEFCRDRGIDVGFWSRFGE